MSDEPTGAVDNDFDNAERDPREIINEKLDEYPRHLKGGDLAIDLVQGRPLYVRRVRSSTAVEYFDEEDFDLTTYKTHPWLPIKANDRVLECVFIPTKPQDIPSSKGDKTYDYPEGRLARVPVEWLYDSDTRPQHDFMASSVAALLSFARADHPETASAIKRVAREAFGPTIVDEAIERIETVDGNAGP